jgi:hypothetical protein
MMKKIQLIVATIATILTVSNVPAFAQSPSPSTTATPTATTSTSPSPSPTSTKKPDTPGMCGSTKTQLISCSSDTGVGTIGDLIKLAISVLTVLIGAVATGGFAYAAFLYATAQDNQDKVSEAIGIVRNIVIGLVLYGFTIAIINWLIPGGVIG